jgi:hypothetical protein
VITMWWIIFNKPSKCTGGTGVDIYSYCTLLVVDEGGNMS